MRLITILIATPGHTVYDPDLEVGFATTAFYGNQTYQLAEDFSQSGGTLTFNVIGLEAGKRIQILLN